MNHSDSRHLLLCLLTFCLSTIAPLTVAAQSDEWTAVTCVPADLPPEAMFDVVNLVDGFEETRLPWKPVLGGQNARCTLHHDPSAGRAEKGTLRVDYEYVGKSDLEYIQISTPLTIPERGLAFGFWVKLDWGLPLRLRITDKSGETHQYELMSRETTEWQFVAALLSGPSTSWGGDGNKRCDYPCRLEGIVFDRPHRGFVRDGCLWIDDVSLLRLRPAQQSLKTAVRGARFGNLYAVGEAVELHITGQHITGQHITGQHITGQHITGQGDRITWACEDYWGQTLAQGEGTGEATAVRFVLPRPGYFSCRIELHKQGRVTEVQQYSCAALPRGRETARSEFVGVCSHYGQNNYPLPSMDLMCAYGIDQFRDEISWRSYERQRGVYALPNHADAFLRHAAELKMRPLIIYDYSNPLYDNDGFPNSPEALAAFAAYATKLTGDTQGIVDMFEVWNEWIGGCGMKGRTGDHGPEAYGRLQEATYAAVKKAFPDVTVVGIGGEYGSECAENIATAVEVAGAASMDAWSIHPYRYPRSPEQSELVEEVARIADRVRRTGAGQKIWITEIGWPTHRTSRGSTESMQAQHCVRTLALLQSTGLVEKVFWYDFKDDGTRRDYNEHNFGLVRHQTYNCAPKPGVVALSTFIRMTGGAEFQTLQSRDAGHAAHYQRPDGRQVIVAWSVAGAQDVKVTGRVEQVVDIMGAEVAGLDIEQLTADPIYIVGQDVKIEMR